MKDRLYLIVDKYCGGAVVNLAAELNMPPTSVYSRLSNPEKSVLAFYSAILKRWPEISAEWLLRGDGDMLKSSSSVSRINENLKKLHTKIDSIIADSVGK